VSHVIVYNVQLRSSGTRARALIFVLNMEQNFGSQVPLFLLPLNTETDESLFPYLKLRSTQKNENTRSHQNRSNCIVFFFCPSRTTAKSSHQIALRLLLSSSPPPSSSPPLPPESGLIASVQRAITIGWYQCLWVSVRMRVRVWVCVSNLPSNRPCPTVLNKRDFPDDGTVSFIFNSIVVLLSGYY
jgi:hypothetical protein